MATESFSWIKSGPINGKTMYFRADAASTPLWAPVIVAAAASGYYLPEVATTATEADQKVIGVACGPLLDSTNNYCNDAAGQSVRVCVWGIVKCKVDATDNIADGDMLISYAGAGYAMLAAVNEPSGDTYVTTEMATCLQHICASFAMALEAATTDGDVIPVFVYGARGTRT